MLAGRRPEPNPVTGSRGLTRTLTSRASRAAPQRTRSNSARSTTAPSRRTADGSQPEDAVEPDLAGSSLGVPRARADVHPDPTAAGLEGRVARVVLAREHEAEQSSPRRGRSPGPADPCPGSGRPRTGPTPRRSRRGRRRRPAPGRTRAGRCRGGRGGASAPGPVPGRRRRVRRATPSRNARRTRVQRERRRHGADRTGGAGARCGRRRARRPAGRLHVTQRYHRADTVRIMADLFDDYPPGPAWDEMIDPDGGGSRAAYKGLHRALAQLSAGELRGAGRDARPVLPRAGRDVRLRRRGAAVPARRRARACSRATSGSTWRRASRQRVRALEAFLADVYGPQRAIADGVIPRSVIVSSTNFLRPPAASTRRTASACTSPASTWSGTSLGGLRVLEDNVRVPSGRQLRARPTAARWRRRSPSCSPPCGSGRSPTTRGGCSPR